MSKNEFLNAVSVYLDELANNQGGLSDEKLKEIIAREIEGQLERYNDGIILEDDLDEKIEEAIEDFASREGYATESMVQSAIDDSLDGYDFSYAIDDELDRRDLVERSEVEDIVDDYIENHDFSDDVDDVVSCYNWESVLENANPDWDNLLSDTRLNERLKALEVKVTMYEILDDLDSIRG